MPLVIKKLNKAFKNKRIFENFDCTFSERGIYVLVGPSGRGKTTLLRMIAGLDKAYDGEIQSEPVAYAFQEYRLFPVLNALENVTNILWEHPTDAQIQAAKNLLSFFGFSEADMKLYPNALSGGMKQRVSLCRALLADRRILLLDEPFKELDDTLRDRLRNVLGEEAKKRLIILTAHTIDALGNLERTILSLE